MSTQNVFSLDVLFPAFQAFPEHAGHISRAGENVEFLSSFDIDF